MEKTENGNKYRDELGRLLPGHPPLEGAGRPIGSNDWQTDFNEVCDEIAKLNNITRSEVRKNLLKVAYANAKAGKFMFYKDIADRYYGEALKRLDVTSQGERVGELPSESQALIEEYEKKLKEIKTK